MARRSAARGAITGLVIIALAIAGLVACNGERACAQSPARTPSPALRTAPGDVATKRPTQRAPRPAAPRTSTRTTTKQHPNGWGSWGRSHDDDWYECDDDD